MDVSKKLNISELYSARGLVIVISGGGTGSSTNPTTPAINLADDSQALARPLRLHLRRQEQRRSISSGEGLKSSRNAQSCLMAVEMLLYPHNVM